MESTSNACSCLIYKDLDGRLKILKAAVESSAIPFVRERQLQTRMARLESHIRLSVQDALSRIMKHQVEAANRDGPFVTLFLSIPAALVDIGGAKLSLIKATRHCPDKPIMVLAQEDDGLVGRCTVPEVSIIFREIRMRIPSIPNWIPNPNCNSSHLYPPNL